MTWNLLICLSSYRTIIKVLNFFLKKLILEFLFSFRAIQIVSNVWWDVPEEVTEALLAVLDQPWGGRELTLYMVLFECVMTVASLPHNINLVTPTLKIVIG